MKIVMKALAIALSVGIAIPAMAHSMNFNSCQFNANSGGPVFLQVYNGYATTVTAASDPTNQAPVVSTFTTTPIASQQRVGGTITVPNGGSVTTGWLDFTPQGMSTPLCGINLSITDNVATLNIADMGNTCSCSGNYVTLSVPPNDAKTHKATSWFSR